MNGVGLDIGGGLEKVVGMEKWWLEEEIWKEMGNGVGEGMKKWGMELGVREYREWLEGVREGRGEKDDGFVEEDGKGGMVEEF